MKIKVNSADVISYNANNRGTYTEDCSIRAISLALDIPYNQASKELKSFGGELYNRVIVLSDFVEEKCGSKLKINKDNPGMTLDEFVDLHNVGTYLVYLREDEKVRGRSGHIVCAIDGKIYDTWDSRKWVVTRYQEISDAPSSRDLTLLSKEENKEIEEELNTYLKDVCEYYCSKLELNIDDKPEPMYFVYNNDSNIFYVDIELYIDEVRKYYEFKLSAPIGKSKDASLKTLKSKLRERVYDRLKDYKTKLMEYEESKHIRDATREVGVDEDNAHRGYYQLSNKIYWPDKYKRFYNNLPGWVKALIYTISLPRCRGDIYSMQILPLPEDSDRRIVRLFGDNSQEIKDALEYYRSSVVDPENFEEDEDVELYRVRR